ncbi:hypothetical protein MtrunA17_Chr4g0039431 [Medicago truncatula]|uniref:Uncharacterized protein n=1 Tax=Medicago truncatula TaxID=3880 RepID=I3S666_MEDTR|nr:unknown [Medicago truncatula]RHN61695.1 hypothetical protein MtrunA17_Chr4g0039431 [Medicago truncatula]
MDCNIICNHTKSMSTIIMILNSSIPLISKIWTTEAQAQALMTSMHALLGSCKDNNEVYHHLVQTSVPSRSFHFA